MDLKQIVKDKVAPYIVDWEIDEVTPPHINCFPESLEFMNTDVVESANASEAFIEFNIYGIDSAIPGTLELSGFSNTEMEQCISTSLETAEQKKPDHRYEKYRIGLTKGVPVSLFGSSSSLSCTVKLKVVKGEGDVTETYTSDPVTITVSKPEYLENVAYNVNTMSTDGVQQTVYDYSVPIIQDGKLTGVGGQTAPVQTFALLRSTPSVNMQQLEDSVLVTLSGAAPLTAPIMYPMESFTDTLGCSNYYERMCGVDVTALIEFDSAQYPGMSLSLYDSGSGTVTASQPLDGFNGSELKFTYTADTADKSTALNNVSLAIVGGEGAESAAVKIKQLKYDMHYVNDSESWGITCSPQALSFDSADVMDESTAVTNVTVAGNNVPYQLMEGNPFVFENLDSNTLNSHIKCSIKNLDKTSDTKWQAQCAVYIISEVPEASFGSIEELKTELSIKGTYGGKQYYSDPVAVTVAKHKVPVITFEPASLEFESSEIETSFSRSVAFTVQNLSWQDVNTQKIIFDENPIAQYLGTSSSSAYDQTDNGFSVRHNIGVKTEIPLDLFASSDVLSCTCTLQVTDKKDRKYISDPVTLTIARTKQPSIAVSPASLSFKSSDIMDYNLEGIPANVTFTGHDIPYDALISGTRRIIARNFNTDVLGSVISNREEDSREITDNDWELDSKIYLIGSIQAESFGSGTELKTEMVLEVSYNDNVYCSNPVTVTITKDESMYSTLPPKSDVAANTEGIVVTDYAAQNKRVYKLNLIDNGVVTAAGNKFLISNFLSGLSPQDGGVIMYKPSGSVPGTSRSIQITKSMGQILPDLEGETLPYDETFSTSISVNAVGSSSKTNTEFWVSGSSIDFTTSPPTVSNKDMFKISTVSYNEIAGITGSLKLNAEMYYYFNIKNSTGFQKINIKQLTVTIWREYPDLT